MEEKEIFRRLGMTFKCHLSLGSEHVTTYISANRRRVITYPTALEESGILGNRKLKKD